MKWQNIYWKGLNKMKKFEDVGFQEYDFDFAKPLILDNMEGMDNGEQYEYLQDIALHGCISGCVSGVIYYHETDVLFKENMKDILNYLTDLKNDYGYNFMESIDNDYYLLPNYSVWLVVEETAKLMLNHMEQLQDDGLIY